ncbi:MAG: hypothetical protein KGH94_00380 [Candidatus Micrarchaeota archaeon]|nr:hypothetical protein [Candidatus Micrarchaeota archaeon]
MKAIQAKAGRTSQDIRDSNGNTPLLLALKEGNLRRAERLARDGADVSARDNHGHDARSILDCHGGGSKHLRHILRLDGVDRIQTIGATL